MAKKVLTTGEVAKYCGVNFRTVIRWVDAGKINAYQLPGRGDRRIKVEDFIDFMNKNGMPIPAEFAADKRDKKKILLVEDDVNLAKVMGTILEKENFEVKIALDGFQAGTFAESFNPDLITLDLTMPGMDGIKVLEFLKGHKNFNSMKILVISAMDEEKLINTLDAGADDYLQKPFDHETFIGKISKLAS